MSIAMKLALSLTNRTWLPDLLIRGGIRHLVRQRLHEISHKNGEELATLKSSFIANMSRSDIAIHPDKANIQHYEVPSEFFHGVLGSHMKYSSGYWPSGVESLSESEESALRESCAHADLHDGQSILDLGCGWGSLSLWMAAHYPHSHIMAVSNSHSQKAYIDAQAHTRGLGNIRVLTCDMNRLKFEQAQFDRVVSVEMFEHMRNWSHLFDRIHDWLKFDGRFFMHIFVHRAIPYTFEVRDESDWMSRYFFTGGMMPSDDLPLAVQSPFRLVNQWRWAGTHYARTANAWLGNMDCHRESLWPLFIRTYGKQNAELWWVRWRIFFMACAELFGHREGQEWWVSHYLFEKADLT